MAYYEYFSGTVTQVSKSTIGSIGSISSMAASSATTLSLNIKEWEFKINGQMFKTKCSGLIEEGDKVAVAARRTGNGFYQANVIRNYTKDYTKPHKVYTITLSILMVIALWFLVTIITFFLAIPMRNVVSFTVGSTLWLVAMLGATLFVLYYAIITFAATKKLQNMPPP